MLYLDYAASTPIRAEALKVLQESMKEDFANPSSAHRLGRDLQKRIESCREKYLRLLGADCGDRFIFTGSATESNNMVILGTGLKAGDKVMVSYADHPSVTAPVEELKKRGVEIGEIPLQSGGTPDEDTFLKLLDERVKLVILAHVNNQSGAVIDICRLSHEIKEIIPKTHIHVDTAQGFGKIPFSFKEGAIDSLSLSAHKLGGPKGIAGILLKEGITVSPLMFGGGQENHLRASTQAAPLIFSFYRASAEAVENIDSSLEHVTRLNRKAREILKEKIQTLRFPFEQYSSPYIMALVLPGISSDIILRHLEQREILISSTSACSSKLKGANPVFTALHLPVADHKFVLRVSFNHDTEEDDVLTFCNALAEIYQDLKKYIK